LQTLLINADPIPGATLMGVVNDNATLDESKGSG
jgi:hypothetical protein